MQKIIKVGNKVTVILENGIVEERLVTEEEFKKIVEAKSDNEIMMILHPDYNEKVKAYNKAMTLMDRIKASKILSTVTILSIGKKYLVFLYLKILLNLL